MEQAADGAGAGGAAGGNGGTPGAGDAASAAPAGGAPAAASALAQGAGAAGAAGGDTPNALFVPEKYLVKNEDGTLNEEASRKAFFEGHGALVKRIGTGDLPPKDASEYAVEKLPEGAPTFEEIKKDPEMQGFLKAAHAKGMTNAQLEFALNEYYGRAQQLVAGAKELDAKAANEALAQVWTDPAALQQNVGHAWRAMNVAAQKAGIEPDDIQYGPLGNNPTFIRLMAALGPEFKEGSVPAVGATGSGAQTVEQLMQSEAYWNDKHPDHKRVSEAVRTHYSQKFGNSPAR